MRIFSAVLLAWSLTSGALAAEPKSSRPQVSSNGRFSVRAIETGPDQCRLQVSQESELLWELPRCLGTADDLYFVSNDGERVWVLKTLPELPDPPKPTKKKKKILPLDLLGKVQVAFLVDRAGQVVQSRNIASFLSVPLRRKTQVLARHFKWLEGVTGIPGQTPRSNARNQVEFEVVGPKTYRLDF